jgi:hypothetical protein
VEGTRRSAWKWIQRRQWRGGDVSYVLSEEQRGHGSRWRIATGVDNSLWELENQTYGKEDDLEVGDLREWTSAGDHGIR